MRYAGACVVVMLLAGACVRSGQGTGAIATPGSSTTTTTEAPTTTSTAPTTTTTAPTTTTLQVFDLSGVVQASDGTPLGGATVTVGSASATTDEAGGFRIEGVPAAPVTVERPAWLPLELDWDGEGELTVELEPRIVRALRVSRYVSMEPDSYADLLDLAEASIINSLVFDTKDETGTVLYESSVETALEIGAVVPVYDPVELLAAARERGLYAITRLVTFEDEVWVNARPEAKLAGAWADAANEENWEYPLALAVEACEIGFDEIQFDYVRFPAGRTAEVARSRVPDTQEGRVAVIQAFLMEARSRLHPMGCAVSADIFGIVTSSPTDEGIGQRPEEISAAVDAISPMIYPSHYSPGWIGFSDPNDHPGPVTGHALDGAGPRMSADSLLRPWLQAFYYNGSQVQAGILEAERRGHGWILWNAGGNYGESWIPTQEAIDALD